MGFWGRRDREAQGRQEALDAELSRRARTALVAADERIRAMGDELAFATAELGDAATAELRIGLKAVQEQMVEAFQLHQLNHDHLPDTPDELRTRNARIVQLCDWAESVLDERASALRDRVEGARRAPRVVAGLRDDAQRLRERLPEAAETLRHLAERYSAEALARVRMNAADAEQLIEFADRSIGLAERHRDAARHAEAGRSIETATESLRRAASVLDAIDGFEIEALRAQATLADVVDDSRGDLAAARTERRTPAVDEAASRLASALAEVGVGAQRDPFADLALVSAANAALEAARERAARPVPTLAHVEHAIAAADHAIGAASRLIDGHRGWIGADARTRLAEARRARSELGALPTGEDLREEAQRLARRAAELADDALRLAQRDIDASGPRDDDWGWDGGRGRPQGGAGMLGPVIGGVILGGLLDELFD